MAKAASTPARIAADIASAASAVAPGEHRSVAEQINHWARLGMQVERSTSVDGRRVRAVLSGDEQFSALSGHERTAAHASVDAAMATRVAGEQFGAAARRAGQVTVSLDDEGNLVEISPDGSRRRLSDGAS